MAQLSPSLLCTFISAYALLKTFSYTSLNIGANGSKCKTKSSVGENDPYKVFQKTYFSPQKAENGDYVSFVPIGPALYKETTSFGYALRTISPRMPYLL